MKARRIAPAVGMALLLLVAIAVAAFFLQRSIRPEDLPLAGTVLAPGVDVELHDVSFSETRHGVRKYLLRADSALYRPGGVSLVRGITVDFFARDGAETMRLRADEGDVAGANQLMTLRGTVVMTSPQGYLLETDHLTYNKADDSLSTDAVVKLTAPLGVLTGRGLLAWPQQERLTVLHDVRGELKRSPSGGEQRLPRGGL